MNTHHDNVFVQIGATRDGLDSYIDAAQARGLRTVLVETADYLHWRRCLGRRPFDLEIPVAHPADPDEVSGAVDSAGLSPALVLAGFERYVDCAFTVAKRLEVGRDRTAPLNPGFKVPDKATQRCRLGARVGQSWQPRHATVALTHAMSVVAHDLGYPLVVKPTDGGGGLGVFVVDDATGLQEALRLLHDLRNYDGADFGTALLEQFVDGVEFSVQGLVRDGEAMALSVCEKITYQENVAGTQKVRGFREVGHISTHGSRATAAIRTLLQEAVTAMGYRNGPFHVDIIVRGGEVYFLEMGFRLSGAALVSLVAQSTGIDWADLVFRLLLGECEPLIAVPTEPPLHVGQIACLSQAELDAGRALVEDGVAAEVLPHNMNPTLDLADLARQRPSLASDLLRHAGIVGRVLVHGDSAAAVRASLARCIASREIVTCAG